MGKEELVTLSPMKVRVDITLMKDGRIRIHNRLAKRFDICEGDAIEVMQYGVETVMRVMKNPDKELYGGTLYRASKKGLVLQWRDIALTRKLMKDGERCCQFRCGDPIDYNGIQLIPIITRKNYYNGNKTDTT